MEPKDIEVEIDTQLGRGACGVVNRAVHRPTGTLLAIKCVRVEEREKREQLMTDLQSLLKLQNSANLVHLYAAYFHKQSGRVHVALELMDLGSLQDFLRFLPPTGFMEPIAAEIFCQTASGLRHLHAHRQIHRDIKPGNILLNSLGEVKIADFGISKSLDSTAGICDTFVGTATYMSPERATGATYSVSADIWSLGIVLYELASGHFPFPRRSSFPALFDFLCNKPEPRLAPEGHSEGVRSAVERCLQRSPEKRASAGELCESGFCSIACGRQDLATYLVGLKSIEGHS